MTKKRRKREKEAVEPKRHMKKEICFFTEFKRKFNNIIITVKDNCLYTNKHTNKHIHISSLIKGTRKKMCERDKRMSRYFFDRRRE
jgi:hypothetical protein